MKSSVVTYKRSVWMKDGRGEGKVSVGMYIYAVSHHRQLQENVAEEGAEERESKTYTDADK